MKKLFSLYAIILSAVLLVSCYKDESNYNLVDVNKITITGINERYVQITARDTLKINPTIGSGADAQLYEYAWIRYSALAPYGIIDTISRDRNLSYPVKGSPGNFHVIYSVKNKTNGLSGNFMLTLEVTSIYSKGHYFLKETEDGNSDMDLLIDDGTVLTDIVKKTNGASLLGKPRSMGVMYNRPVVDPYTLTRTNAHALGLITFDKKVGIYRVADMYQLFDHTSMFYAEPNDIPYKFYTNHAQSVYLSSSGVYTTSGIGTGKYGAPVNEAVIGASDQWAMAVGNVGFVYWDEINRRILFHNYQSIAMEITTTTNFPTTNLNYNCVFMGNTGNVVNILFRDRSDASKMSLYQLTSVAPSPFTVPTVASIRNIASTSKLHTATYFGANERTAQMIYFVNANKLYYYNLTNNEEVAILPQGLPADETITYVSNRFNYYETPKLDFFTVATYKDGNYKVFMYNMVGGLPVGAAVRTASGKGKIKEIHHVGTTYNSITEGGGSLLFSYSR
ncbi:hypothetical protein LPB86_00555 [Pedobacter sp. MC2016-14]|uniref:PKD-like family lipoprotein n=1 Tax=Pedobacter sp. MC2016-14 TaxID=2897327 RepID=UPI001E35EA91|nr:PKD-like family lipoprotein [Pedobacter sp. MC2016-14]MCD0486696.1 hypothetical protein [Pedobacter sp. MC2016-14]